MDGDEQPTMEAVFTDVASVFFYLTERGISSLDDSGNDWSSKAEIPTRLT